MSSDKITAARRLVLGSLRALEASDRALYGAPDGRFDEALRTYVEDVRAARRHCEALERLLLEDLQSDPAAGR